MEQFSSSRDVLFDETVPVRVVEKGSAPSTASARSLKLLVQIRDRTSAVKELLVRLTDEQDPFLLYTCIVCDEDYQLLRQHQGLLIDFAAFPHKFVELVNTCISESQHSSPRFILVLHCNGDGGGPSTLEIVEVNIFKHLCHLALNLAPASTQVKLTYLADCCKALKADIISKEREAAENEQQLRQQIRHLQDMVSKTSSEAQHLKTKLDQQSVLSSEKHAHLIHQEKEKLLKLQSDADRKADRERRELEARMNHRVEHLQAKINTLTAQNGDLSEKKHRAESTAKELRSKLSNVEGELERIRQELSHTKKHNSHLDQDYQSKCRLTRELEARAAQLEAELRSKETNLAHTQQMTETLQKQKIDLEEALEERRQKLSKRENSIQLLYAEFQKSLDIIKKLQKKVKEEHMTSKVRGAALVEQDKVVGEKDSKVTELSNHMQELTTKLSQLTLDNDKLQTDLREASEKLQEQDKVLKTNENVIAWLNKQLNEAELAGMVIKRAPLTEAYLTSHNLPSHGVPSAPHGIVSHSTPLSSNLHSFPTVSSGWSGATQRTSSSVRHFGNIPPIPEEISPRDNTSPQHKDYSPPNKENTEGLESKYLEPLNSAAVPVQGLLRANFQRVLPSEPVEKLRPTGDVTVKKVGHHEKQGLAGKGVGRKPANTKKTGLVSKKQSSYFPRT